MKLKLMCMCLLCFFVLNIPNEVYAHPGRTDANGCHYCRTNCSKWGLKDGEYHCHNGGDSSVGSSSSSNSYNSTDSSNSVNSYNAPITSLEPQKSNDNTLKTVLVDEVSITVADQMQYETNKDEVKISVETNDDKAEYTINNKKLVVGENNINISVEAEDGTEKVYELTVERLTKSEELINGVVGIILIAGIGYGIYYFIKKRKKNVKK